MTEMKFTKEQKKLLSIEKKSIFALGKLQDQSFKKCLKELKLKDGTTPAQFLWDYLFLTGISVKEFEKSLDKAIKIKDTGDCDAGCDCKH